MRFQLRWFRGNSLSLKGDHLQSTWPSPAVAACEEMAEGGRQSASRGRGPGIGNSSLRAPIPERFRDRKPLENEEVKLVRAMLGESTVTGGLKTPQVACASFNPMIPGRSQTPQVACASFNQMIPGRSQTPQVASATSNAKITGRSKTPLETGVSIPIASAGLPGVGRGIPHGLMHPPPRL